MRYEICIVRNNEEITTLDIDCEFINDKLEFEPNDIVELINSAFDAGVAWNRLKRGL